MLPLGTLHDLRHNARAAALAQSMELGEHYDNTEDMYCDLADRLEAVEAAAPAASLGGVGGHTGPKSKDAKVRGSGGGGKVRARVQRGACPSSCVTRACLAAASRGCLHCKARHGQQR